MVVMCLSATALTGSEHERMGTPSTCTVQAPHSAIPQPYLVPIRPSVSRSTQSRGVSESTSTSQARPLTVRRAIPSLSTGPPKRRFDRPEISSKRSCAQKPNPRWRIARGHSAGGAPCASTGGRRRPMRPPPRGVSRHLDVVVLQRERADALARGLEERIEHGGRGDADRRLADATPETAGWHDDRLD